MGSEPTSRTARIWGKIGRAHVCTPLTATSRIPSFFLMMGPPPRSTLFPCAALFRFSRTPPFGVNSAPDDVFRADEPYRPYLGYGRSKMDAELIVRAAVDAGDLDAVIVRPPWFYGPFQPERQTSFFRLVRRGIFPLFGVGENRRSMVYIGNLVDGIVRAEQQADATGKAYWIADARPYPMT